MKKINKYLAIVFLFMIFLITGCQTGGNTPVDPDNEKINITATQEKITLKDTEVNKYDFTKLFIIKVNDKEIKVLDEYIDKTQILDDGGIYEVTCTYKEEKASVSVEVIETVYTIDLTVSEITINQSLIDTYDYLALFVAKIDGKSITITDDMIESNIATDPGKYSFTVRNGKVSKTLIVNVTEDHLVEVIASSQNIDLFINEVESFDYTKLFSLYVDGKAVKVTNEMIDKSALNQAVVGQIYEVVFKYKIDKTSITKTVKVTILEEQKVVITAKNVVIYPNSELIDLTTLFEIKKGNQIIPVTSNMISGTVDYSKVGVNEITLTYETEKKVAIVEVRLGVIINYATSDTIIITKGSNINNYQFMNDFVVLINGIRFENITDTYLDKGDIDFNTPGSYQVKLTIPYNDNRIGLQGVKFTNFEKIITYVVVENNYKISLDKEVVELPKETTNYDVLSNISVVINNRNQQLTQIKEYVDVITCYVEILSKPLDFNSIVSQIVEIAVYANGIDNLPVIVKYEVIVESDVKIEAKDAVIFSEDTVDLLSLFKVTSDGKKIELSFDMLSGNVDVFVPGIYKIKLTYGGISKTSNIIVIDKAIKGIYHTNLTTIPVEEEEEDNNEGWGDEYGEYSVKAVSPTTPLGDMIINDKGQIYVNNSPATIVRGIDENTLIIKIGSNDYTLYYDNGIIVLDPDNSIKLGFSDYRRPLIYFNEQKWELGKKVVINYGKSHVLEQKFISYSIDTFNLKSKLDGNDIWYGLKIRLIEKNSADTIYEVTWGEVFYDNDFKMEIDNKSSLVLNGEKYEFTMISNNIGKINSNADEKPFKDMTFNGVIDNKPSELRFNQYGGLEIYIDSIKVVDINTADINNMKNGIIDAKTGIVFVYGFDKNIYSYKFKVDTNNLTFTQLQRDSYFGSYVMGTQRIFVDGFGTGVANFNTKSYYEHQFRYNVNNNILKMEYFNTNSNFSYGKYMELYINPLLNVLTVKDSYNGVFNGNRYENTYITDGAIINIESYKVGQDSDAIAKAELYSLITIITKDGILTNDQKAKLIDTSCIRFSTPGFYQFTITIDINGTKVLSYYAIEIIEKIYEGNPVIAAYGLGIINSSNILSIDKYGRAFVTTGGLTYIGTVKINDDYSFVISAKNSSNGYITIVGKYLTQGLIEVQCTGVTSFIDYFTTGTHRISGTNNFVLRQIKLNSQYIYMYSPTITSVCQIVEVEEISDTIMKVTTSANDTFVKILDWSDGNNGLLLADEYRGIYTLNGSPDLVVDGFGNAIIGDISGTYMISGSTLTLSTITNAKVYKIDKTNKTYENVDIILDNSLVCGKTYVASHAFICDSYFYNAETTFIFGENGKVIIKSISPSHDDGEEACTEDRYDPTFASKEGTSGTYFVSGNKVTVKVNGEEFTFLINNVLDANTLTCISTTLERNEHGYFEVNTMFLKK